MRIRWSRRNTRLLWWQQCVLKGEVWRGVPLSHGNEKEGDREESQKTTMNECLVPHSLLSSSPLPSFGNNRTLVSCMFLFNQCNRIDREREETWVLSFPFLIRGRWDSFSFSLRIGDSIEYISSLLSQLKLLFSPCVTEWQQEEEESEWESFSVNRRIVRRLSKRREECNWKRRKTSMWKEMKERVRKWITVCTRKVILSTIRWTDSYFSLFARCSRGWRDESTSEHEDMSEKIRMECDFILSFFISSHFHTHFLPLGLTMAKWQQHFFDEARKAMMVHQEMMNSTILP